MARRMADRGVTTFHASTVQRVEAGSRPVRLDEAVAIAGALGVPLATLLEPMGEERQRAMLSSASDFTAGLLTDVLRDINTASDRTDSAGLRLRQAVEDYEAHCARMGETPDPDEVHTARDLLGVVAKLYDALMAAGQIIAEG